MKEDFQPKDGLLYEWSGKFHGTDVNETIKRLDKAKRVYLDIKYSSETPWEAFERIDEWFTEQFGVDDNE